MRLPVLVAAVLSAGCSSLLVSSNPPPLYYQLDYKPVPVSCPRAFDQGVRVWEFSDASPFNRQEMVVVTAGGEVTYSQSYRWVAPPGTLVAQSLLRDLSRDGLFPLAVGTQDPAVVPLALTGRIFRFGWDKRGSQARADLAAEVALIEEGSPSKVLFRKEYSLASKPTPDAASSARFAETMSALVREFSARVRRDLCAIGSSERSGRMGDRRAGSGPGASAGGEPHHSEGVAAVGSAPREGE